MLVIAHRGASQKTPENTISALQQAAHDGATCVECDVQMTLDHKLIIFHDNRLQRTTNGRGAVADHALSDILSLDAGQWFDAAFLNERVPTLLDWLKNAVYLRLSLHIEVKATPRYKKVIDGLLATLDEVWPADLDKPIISSFSHRALRYLASKGRSDLKYALGVDKWLFFYPQFLYADSCVSLHLNKLMVTQNKVKKFQAMGKRVLVFTVNDLVEAKRLESWGVDGIFSDNMELLKHF